MRLRRGVWFAVCFGLVCCAASWVCLVRLSAASSPDSAAAQAQNSKDTRPPVTLDEFFDSVSFPEVEMSPDGSAVVFVTERADWKANRFRDDLWLYRVAGGGESSGSGGAGAGASDDAGGALIQLTSSGHDDSPQWSPDGKWIAFLSDRAGQGEEEEGEGRSGARGKDELEGKTGADHKKVEKQKQIFVIAAEGGEAFAVTDVDDGIHAFAWAGDSRAIFVAGKAALSKPEKESQEKEWKDVIRFRESERGDAISRVDVAGIEAERMSGKISAELSGRAREICKIADRAAELAVSPDGKRLTIRTEARSERWEKTEPYAIYVAELSGGADAVTPRVISHDPAFYDRIRWAADSRHLFFSFLNGSAEAPYHDAQERIYSVDAGQEGSVGETGVEPRRWAGEFTGSMGDFRVLGDGSLWAGGRVGTEVATYTQVRVDAPFVKAEAWAGTYEHLASGGAHSKRVAFVYSAIDKPAEVYLADSVSDLNHAKNLTAFNKVFTERAQPQAKTFQWKADDGVTVEGELIFPPGRFGEKNLRMFTLIHGGPEDADGNHFEADWYQWAILAASNGWLVFEPNYRGSVGYGDKFALGIVGPIVSRPGKDILEGVDALVKDGTADAGHLTVGGYSYGGYMTNWLITQTTRFKAAVTGAGAVENVANWGNDDTTVDDAYFLGGVPWEAEKNYNAEAAIWQFGKVTTPTHVVGGAEDVRVYVGEDYLLERALFTRGIPCSLLIFPGEGHSLDDNPWHGKIKVREELKWLEKYGMR